MIRSSLGSGSFGQSWDKFDLPGELKHSRHFKPSKFLKEFHPKHLAETTVQFWRGVPSFFWTFFIEAFIIPAYRPEWGVYTSWKVIAEPVEVASGRIILRKPTDSSPQKRKKKRHVLTTIPVPVPHDHAPCQIITINVSGKRFQTQLGTLLNFPETLLGNPARLAQFYDPVNNDYFFDRNRICFSAILYYYQSVGILRRPYNISIEIFEEEMRFYDLGIYVIERFRREEGVMLDVDKPIPRALLRRKYWLLFEYPESSKQARLVAILSVFVVILSIVLFCCETMNSFRRIGVDEEGRHDDDMEDPNMRLESIAGGSGLQLADPFFFGETVCITWFVFEFVMRVMNAPRLSAFFKSVANLIDLASILPYFLTLTMTQQQGAGSGGVKNKATTLTIFRVVRLVRVFRILKLSRHNRGLKVLGKTLRASMRELGLLMFFLVIGVILFSSVVYFAELNTDSDDEPTFSSIVDAFWWSVITMVI